MILIKISRICRSFGKIHTALLISSAHLFKSLFKIFKILYHFLKTAKILIRERSGSAVECLTRDRRAAGSSLTGSDSFTILGLWVLGLAVSHINESQLQTYESRTLFLMTSLQYYCILGLDEIKTLHPRDKIMRKRCRMHR